MATARSSNLHGGSRAHADHDAAQRCGRCGALVSGHRILLALRRLGKEAYLFVYNGEPHGLRRRPNQKDYTVRLQQYFDHFLKGAPKPDWMERGIPYLESHPAPAGAAPPEETAQDAN